MIVFKRTIRKKIAELQVKINICKHRKAKINETSEPGCVLNKKLDLEYKHYSLLIYEHEAVQRTLNDLLQ